MGAAGSCFRYEFELTSEKVSIVVGERIEGDA